MSPSPRSARRSTGSLAVRIACVTMLLPACRGTTEQIAPPTPDPGQNAMGMGWGDPGDTEDTDTSSSVAEPTLTWLEAVTHSAIKHPLRLAADSEGTVYLTDPSAGGVHVISAAGDYSHLIKTVPYPMGIAVDASDQLVVGDPKNGRIVIMTTAGTEVATCGDSTDPIKKATDIAVDTSTGTIWAVASRADEVVSCDEDGNLLTSFGSSGTGDGEFGYPSGIAFDADAGELYVTDSGNRRIQVFDTDGNYQRTLGSGGSGDGKIARGKGLAVDADGRVYLADIYQSQVEVFDTDGNFVSWISELGGDDDDLFGPSDVLFDATNRLWVTSTHSRKIVVWGVDSYTEPTVPLPAHVVVNPSSIPSKSRGKSNMDLYIDIASSAEDLDASSIQIGSSFGLSSSSPVRSNVVFKGARYEGQYRFRRSSLLSILSSTGDHEVEVSGTLDDGSAFEGTFTITVK